jgi:hypothetical protein
MDAVTAKTKVTNPAIPATGIPTSTRLSQRSLPHAALTPLPAKSRTVAMNTAKSTIPMAVESDLAVSRARAIVVTKQMSPAYRRGAGWSSFLLMP